VGFRNYLKNARITYIADYSSFVLQFYCNAGVYAEPIQQQLSGNSR